MADNSTKEGYEESTDILTLLGLSPEELLVNPDSPDKRIFHYHRKKRNVWVQLPSQPKGKEEEPKLGLEQEQEKLVPVPVNPISPTLPHVTQEEPVDPPRRKRGRPRKIRPDSLLGTPIKEPKKPKEPKLKHPKLQPRLKPNLSPTEPHLTELDPSDTRNTPRKKPTKPSPVSPELDLGSESLPTNNDPLPVPDGIPLDTKGELKIHPDGSLKGDREFRMPVFQLSSRPNQYFMLAAPLYRCLGFTDRRQLERGWPDLPVYDLSVPDRESLMEIGLLRTIHRGFRVCIVPAKEAFMFFGHKIVEKGLPVRDDYYENPRLFTRREVVPRKPSHPNPNSTTTGTTHSTLIQIEDTSDEFDSDGGHPSPRFGFNDVGDNKEEWDRTRIPLATWMAQSAQRFNARLTKFRKTHPKYYDPHTNLTLYPNPVVPLRDEKICQVDDSLLELLPTDMQLQIRSLRQQSTPTFTPHRFPLALTETQYQSTIPLHSTRFGQTLDEGEINFLRRLRYAEQPLPSSSSSYIENFISSVQSQPNKPQLSRNNSGGQDNPRENSKENPRDNISSLSQSPVPRITCGYPRAVTNVPCAVPVAHPGKLCHFHRKLADQPLTTPGDDSEDSDTEFTLCVFCRSSSAPTTALDANGGVKLQPHSEQLREVLPTDTVSCAECRHLYHLWCIQIIDFNVMERMRSYDWVCNDCKCCSVCMGPDQEETLLFCDGCDRAQHMACCTPPILELPTGGWKCQICS